MTNAKVKPIIAVDIDDVLAPLNHALMLFVNQQYQTAFTVQDYRVRAPYMEYWQHVWGVSKEEARARFVLFAESGALQKLDTINGAIPVMAKLEQDYTLTIVTARLDEFVDLTHQWLEKHFPKIFKTVKFVPLWGASQQVTKAQICKEVGASYLVDDNLEHCSLAAEAGLTALLFGNYGWNMHEALPERVIRVADWQAVGKFFHGKG